MHSKIIKYRHIGKTAMYLIQSTTIIILLLILNGCMAKDTTNTSATYGVLEGNVTIGPMSPIEQSGTNSIVPLEVFQKRNIWIYNKNLTKRITTVNISQIGQTNQGYFTVELEPGIYMVDINYHGIDTSDDVPEFVDIIQSQITSISIKIDTGIR